MSIALLPSLQELRVQEDELEAVRWMPLEEYVRIPFTTSRQGLCIPSPPPPPPPGPVGGLRPT